MSACAMCGSSVPDGQKICSMCYGDPDYGNDGYYRQQLEQEAQRQQEQQEQEAQP